MDGLAFVSRLAASIPGPRFHTVRYAGVLSAAAKWRPLIVPEEPDSPGRDAAAASSAAQAGASGDEPKARSSWRPWRELLKRSFDIDLLCPKCGAPMKLKAFLVSPQSLRRLLTTLGERIVAPQRAPPQAPPYLQTRAVVRERALADGERFRASSSTLRREPTGELSDSEARWGSAELRPPSGRAPPCACPAPDYTQSPSELTPDARPLLRRLPCSGVGPGSAQLGWGFVSPTRPGREAVAPSTPLLGSRSGVCSDRVGVWRWAVAPPNWAMGLTGPKAAPGRIRDPSDECFDLGPVERRWPG
jgi:hypothetical protein